MPVFGKLRAVLTRDEVRHLLGHMRMLWQAVVVRLSSPILLHSLLFGFF